ncbi:hypothetical protein MUP77_19670 [Candidatus Bathyarchaeota archaeon]|nr:hypothetical protein [Candidatus Bathyarchaeota archaeon]
MSLGSDTLLTVEFAGLILVTLFFTMIYEFNEDASWCGLISWVTWNVVGIFFLMVFPATAIISLFFMALGWIYLTRFIVDVLTLRGIIGQKSRRMIDEYD